MSATQTIGGVELPAAGTWAIDPGHAEIGFVGRHFGLTKIRGRFTAVEGTVQVAGEPTDSTVEVAIDMASVESGSTDRDNHLRSSDFFDVDNYPTAHFRSTAVTVEGTREPSPVSSPSRALNDRSCSTSSISAMPATRETTTAPCSAPPPS
jgi:polyisoprenoid-binding protein YceI